jgi:hypothetical protein
MRFVTYSLSTGAILFQSETSSTAEEVFAIPAGPDRGRVEIPEPLDSIQRFRVVDGAVVPRAEMALTVSADTFPADGTTACVISGLPDPCTVEISGSFTVPPTPVTGGAITLTTSQPGVLTIRVTADPHYLSKEITLYAV